MPVVFSRRWPSTSRALRPATDTAMAPRRDARSPWNSTEMPAERALRLAAYMVVALGVMALWVAELLGAWGTVVVVLALAGGGWLRRRVPAGPRLDRGLALAVAGFAVLDVVYFADRVFDGMVRLLVLL